MNFNDLIGLEHGWGGNPGDGSGKADCFLLACEVHKRLGYHDYREDFGWVFEQYTEHTFPFRWIIKWLNENGTRLAEPKPHAVVLLDGSMGAALGTVMDDGDVLFIAPSRLVVRSKLPGNIGHYFWMNQ
jgi:hypothetical protein